MQRKIPLPRGWKRRVKSSVLHILALSQYAFTALLAREANERGRQARLRAKVDRLNHELALLREELRLKDARMERLRPHRRPHYLPLERMAILDLRGARGWSARQAAERFHVTATTLGAWKARINEHGPYELLQIRVPVNKFPDLVRYIVRRLKLLCPRLGKVKIAEMLSPGQRPKFAIISLYIRSIYAIVSSGKGTRPARGETSWRRSYRCDRCLRRARSARKPMCRPRATDARDGPGRPTLIWAPPATATSSASPSARPSTN